MIPRIEARVARASAWFPVVAMLWLVPGAAADDPPDASARAVTPKGAIEPAASLVPAEVVAAMQAGEYDLARRHLVELAARAKTADDRSYFAYLEAIAARLGGGRTAARAVLMKSMLLDPDSRWAVKIRYELAGLELADGNWAAAEELARTEAVKLLAGDRKDRLAAIYRGFAERLLEPGDPLVPPDPNAAYDMLAQARELAESPALRIAPLCHGPRQQCSGQPGPRAGKFPAVSRRVSRRSRQAGRPVSARPGRAKDQSTTALPPNLDGPGPRYRALEARPNHQ